MAHLRITGIDVWDDVLKGLGHPEKIAKEAINAAVPILEKTTRAAVKASSNSDKLAQSFTRTPAKENNLGVYSVVRPTGDFNEDLSNEDLAAQFEYGRKGDYLRSGMQRPATAMRPRPWRAKAINSARAECEKIMEETIYREVDKL